MNDLETLFLPFSQRAIQPDAASKILFLNARYHEHLTQFQDVLAQQFFKPYAQGLEQKNIAFSAALPDQEQIYDLVLVLLPKNMVEAKGLLAGGLLRLKDGGMIVCAADNKAGGARLGKIFAALGIDIISEESKHKARVMWGCANSINKETLQQAILDAQERDICDGAYRSVPGIFGWDKIDRGSQILLSALPQNIGGQGADFGCGYGYLSAHILNAYPKVKKICCIDADYRALQMSRKNLASQELRTSFMWHDLSHAPKSLSGLDFIVMNPPFHEGRSTEIGLGISFIQNAAQALRNNGALYMVANKHLPYEQTLASVFSSVEKISEQAGFKIFCARK